MSSLAMGMLLTTWRSWSQLMGGMLALGLLKWSLQENKEAVPQRFGVLQHRRRAATRGTKRTGRALWRLAMRVLRRVWFWRRLLRVLDRHIMDYDTLRSLAKRQRNQRSLMPE
jgi:hypothetical protein